MEQQQESLPLERRVHTNEQHSRSQLTVKFEAITKTLHCKSVPTSIPVRL
jgi:hypothetical protein